MWANKVWKKGNPRRGGPGKIASKRGKGEVRRLRRKQKKRRGGKKIMKHCSKLDPIRGKVEQNSGGQPSTTTRGEGGN